jgi:hypothetical protein
MVNVNFDEEKFLAALQEYVDTAELLQYVEAVRLCPIAEKAAKAMSLIDYVLQKAKDILGDINALKENEDLMNTLVGFIDDCIKLPFYLEWLDGPAIKAVLGAVIDVIAKYSK